MERRFEEVRREVRELREGRQAERDAHQRRQEAKLLDYDASAFRKDAPIPNQGAILERPQVYQQIHLL